MIKINLATVSDVSALNELVNSAYRGDGSKEGWTTEADLLGGLRSDEKLFTRLIEKEGSVILKYTEDDNLLACVNLVKENERLYLGMLTVSPRLQGKGIGKILLKEAEKYAKENACNLIYMSVISERKELIDWYLRHGYVLTNERKPFIVGPETYGVPKMQLEFVTLEKRLE